MTTADSPHSIRRPFAMALGVTTLLLIMAAELVFSVRRQSQTFDEAAHIFAGYSYWKHADYGVNPEHPPLVKLVAALPLLPMRLNVPAVPDGDFKAMEFSAGRAFLYSNDAGSILFRARLAAALFTLALAAAVFFLANSLFGAGPAFLALGLFVFEPNFLAHGALVTTDVAAALGLFLGVGAFHLYLKKPSALRLVAAGLAAGLCLGVKHSGLLLVPMLFAVALPNLPKLRAEPDGKFAPVALRIFGRRAAAILAVCAMALFILWSAYGFRFAARPSDLPMTPSLSAFSQSMRPASAAIVRAIARFHLLPESYLYGVAEIFSPKTRPTSLFGRFYPSARWFYFPAIFVIKSTAGFLLLCCAIPFTPAIWRKRTEILTLLLPAAIYLAAAMYASLNLGVRHLLPLYPFLIVLAGTAAWNLATRHRPVAVAVAVLFAAHAASSLRAYPNYIPYANELWGGPAHAYRVVADSNVDWGQGLIALKQYTDQHHIEHCWFAYFGSLVSDASYYGIPCQPLPTAFSALLRLRTPFVPPQLDGPVFVSASEVSTIYWQADWANPYRRLQSQPPAALIADSILMYDGKVDLPEVSALTHENAALELLNAKLLEPAMFQAGTAVAVAPNRPLAHAVRATILNALNRSAEAQQELSTAQSLVKESQAKR